jgi:hypothetical protein
VTFEIDAKGDWDMEVVDIRVDGRGEDSGFDVRVVGRLDWNV